MPKEQNVSFQVLILDADRNPIKKQKYRLYFNGAMVAAETGEDGLTKKIRTQSASDEVQVAIERIDGSMKIVTRAVSGVGSKLVTLVSPKVKLESSTLPHPTTMPGKMPSKREPILPSYDLQHEKVSTAKKDFGTVTEQTKNKDGYPIAKVEGDIPNLEFIGTFSGEAMGEDDYLWAARELDVECAAIKAFAIVESEGSGFLTVGKQTVPRILYERHKFAAFTNNVYSKLNPDISLPCAYYNIKDRYVLADDSHKNTRKVPKDVEYYRPLNNKDGEKTKQGSEVFQKLVEQGKLERDTHVYFNGIGSYKRLIKAYKLDPDAALKSCSWGAFQIMGEFWREMGFASAVEFSKSMSRSPKDQIKAFVLYIKHVNPAIRKYLKCRDWEAAARAYNGPGYRVNKYHTKLQAAYEKFKDEKL
jgi:hypothetical protein